MIKIGVCDYEVIETDEILLLDNQVCNGLIDFSNLKIKLKKDMPDSKKMQILWHEIFHGIIHEWGADLTNEENTVDWLAKGMIQLIKDNPNLFPPQ